MAMSVESTRLLRQRRVAAGLCVDCESPVGNHTRCDCCHEHHIAANRARKNRGIYACTQCRQKGHNAATCEAGA
jgi:hypothetical protein